MQCPSCGTQNKNYYHYCYFCGNALPEDYDSDTPKKTTLYSSEKYIESPKNEQDSSHEIFPLQRQTRTLRNRFSVNYIKLGISSALLISLLLLLYFSVSYVVGLFFGTEQVEAVSTTANVESTILEGNPAQKITINTNIGEYVEVLGRQFPVNNGQAEIVFDNAFLHSRFPNATSENGVEISLEIGIFVDGILASTETFTFVMELPLAPLTLIQPASAQATVIGENFRLVFSVSEGSQIFINNDEFTDLLDETGRFQTDLIVPENSENSFEIRVSKRGFRDNNVIVLLNRQVQIVPLTLGQTLPIPTDTSSVRVSGTTDPQAQISTDLEVVSEPVIDPATGAFSIEIASNTNGLIAGTLTSTLSDGQISETDLIILRKVSESDYTRRAWNPDFTELFADPILHNGQIFVFRGVIDEVLLYGTRNIFTVRVNQNGSEPHIVLVEYWGEFNFKPEDPIRIFGNRWGNHSNKVRILAPFVYP